MKNVIVIFLFLFFSTHLQGKIDPIKVLIIDGYSNHDWRYTTEIIKTMLANSGFCDVDILTAPTNNSNDYNSWSSFTLKSQNSKLKVFSDGKQAGRFDKIEGKNTLIVNDQWDYNSLLWGNSMKLIYLEKEFGGSVVFSAK